MPQGGPSPGRAFRIPHPPLPPHSQHDTIEKFFASRAGRHDIDDRVPEPHQAKDDAGRVGETDVHDAGVGEGVDSVYRGGDLCPAQALVSNRASLLPSARFSSSEARKRGEGREEEEGRKEGRKEGKESTYPSDQQTNKKQQRNLRIPPSRPIRLHRRPVPPRLRLRRRAGWLGRNNPHLGPQPRAPHRRRADADAVLLVHLPAHAALLPDPGAESPARVLVPHDIHPRQQHLRDILQRHDRACDFHVGGLVIRQLARVGGGRGGGVGGRFVVVVEEAQGLALEEDVATGEGVDGEGGEDADPGRGVAEGDAEEVPGLGDPAPELFAGAFLVNLLIGMGEGKWMK